MALLVVPNISTRRNLLMATVRLFVVLGVILAVIWRCGVPALVALPAILAAVIALLRLFSDRDDDGA